MIRRRRIFRAAVIREATVQVRIKLSEPSAVAVGLALEARMITSIY